MKATNILIIEDDAELNKQLGDLLHSQGYLVDQCQDGEEGLRLAIEKQQHLILLDVMLPERDGFSVLNVLRESRQTPVIMLTAKGAEEERIKGFTCGADDYLAKPFNTTELLLRIEALLRRSYNEVSNSKNIYLNHDGLYMDRLKQKAHIHDETLELTPVQFKLLWILVSLKGETLSKAYLYQAVLNRTFSAYDRSIDMHLSRVRKKLINANWSGERLQTIHGKGYRLV